jgi:hypothetical protein
MMSNENIVTFPEPGSWDDYFGVCPICQRQNGCRSIGRDHWFVCDTHKMKWWVGSNLFSSWRDQTEEELRANMDKLARYREVEVAPPRDRMSDPSTDEDAPF